jgi:hypothetical protein
MRALLLEVQATLRKVLASAYPDPVFHPTMTAAWATVRDTLGSVDAALVKCPDDAPREALAEVLKFIAAESGSSSVSRAVDNACARFGVDPADVFDPMDDFHPSNR